MMIKITKLLLSLLFVYNFAYADDSDKALENNTYVEEQPSDSSCTFKCPTPKDGYFMRIRDVIPQNGETQCFVYKGTDASTILGYVSTVNQQCKKQFNLTAEEEYQVDTTKSDDEFGLDAIKKKYTENYINVGSSKTYVTTSKYIVAGLTADDEIVDIPTTILKNKLTLNGNYTIYPNASTGLPDESIMTSVMSTLGGWWDGIVSNVTGVEAVKEQYKGRESELSSLNEIMFSSVIVLMLTWLAESNSVFLSMNSTMFFWVFPATLILFLVSKITKKMGDKQDHEDNFERGFLTALILWVFYFASGEVDVDSDKKITYTNFQTYSRPILYEGVKFADDLNMAFTKAYISYKARDAGLIYQQDYKKIYDETAKLTKENEVLSKDGGMIGLCYEAYDTDRLYKLASTAVGANTVFPPLGSLNKNRKGKPDVSGKDTGIGISNLEETSFLKDGYRRANNVPTLSACYQFERRFKENKKTLESNELIKTQYENAMSGNKAKEGIKLVAELMFKNSADMGFINASNIASVNILIDNIDLFANASIKEASTERTMELDNQVTDYETSYVTSSNMPWYSGARWMMQNSAYMMVPPASSIKENVIEPFLLGVVAVGAGGIEKITFGGNIGILKQALKKLTSGLSSGDMSESYIKSLVSFIALILTILFMKKFLLYMPLVAISVASYLAIGFYYVSVEIFYLVAPFIAIYALSSDQMNVLKSFLSRFLALAFKPPLIVLSVIMAIMAMEIFDKLAKLTSHKTFDSFFALTNFDRTHWDSTDSAITNAINYASNNIKQFADFSDYMLLLFKGILLVGSQAVQLLAVFYLVFYGSTMILNIFGFKDSGSDVQDTVGSAFESKTSKYNTAM